jgi:hypothetical protein
MMAIYIIFHPHNNNNIKEENKLLRLAIIFCSFLPGAGFSFSHCSQRADFFFVIFCAGAV